ncbi:MAG: hypothetical protein GC171_04115 [Terrimonas sp.]|nr:hypothetical protein [Terrimonas sp.]
MKTAKLIFLLFLFPLLLPAQKTLTGIWVGNLSNDSAAARNDQRFEMALTEYRGKVYGYSYATFIDEDRLYYIVKRVKGTIQEGVCEVEDDEIVSNNFYDKRDKGVKQTITFRMNPVDSTWQLDGTWKTNKTKKYYAISGNISLKEEKDKNKSRLYQHLGDLDLQNTVTLDDREKKKPEQPPQPQQEKKEKKDIAVGQPVKKTVTKEIAATDKKETKKKTNEVVVSAKETAVKKSAPAIAPVIPPPAAAIATRKNYKEEVVYFTSDSLVLALYDNGEVDGDTVSVLLNGEVIMANQCLKSTAIKKTIYIQPALQDSLELVLYAENLGLYPPNTGLLIIYDGKDRYMIRFSADYDKNATVILRRKKE